MKDWNLTILFTLPHERLLVGWELLVPDKECQYYTFSLCLGIITFSLDWE
jgi:hypothetical protein